MSDWREIAKEFGAIDWAVGGNQIIMTSDNTTQRMSEEIIRLREALQDIRYSGLSQGFAGDTRSESEALDDAHNIANAALKSGDKE